MCFYILRPSCWRYSILLERCGGADGSPVAGVKERIQTMLQRHADLSEEVQRLEAVVEKQGRELEVMNSNRMGMYDDMDNSEGVVTQRMVDEEDDQVKALEDKIKEMQEQVFSAGIDGWGGLMVDCEVGWEDYFYVIVCIFGV